MENIQNKESLIQSLPIRRPSITNPPKSAQKSYHPSVSALDLAIVPACEAEHKKASANQKAARFLKSLQVNSSKLKRTFSNRKLRNMERKMKILKTCGNETRSFDHLKIGKPILKKYEEEIDDIVIWEEDFNGRKTLIQFL